MSDTQLTVTLDGGGIEDARAVVRALQDVFGEPDEVPTDERATNRTATFSSAANPEPSGTTRGGNLSAPVTVTVQGSHRRPWRRPASRPTVPCLRHPGRGRRLQATRSGNGNCSWCREVQRAPAHPPALDLVSLIRRSYSSRDGPERRPRTAPAAGRPRRRSRACSGERAPGITVVTPGCWTIQRSAS
ncbi:hypothetical protein SFUMM280S_05844 [Streptomyces fumanus]